MRNATIALLCLLVPLAGCTSIKSTETTSKGGDGLVYYLPKKDFFVEYTVSGKKVIDIQVGTTDAYPDTSHAFVLRHSENAFGKSKLDVTVSSSGLLSSATSTMESGLSEAFQAAAGIAGGSGADTMAFDAAKPAMPCEDGKYRARILPDKKDVEIALQCGWKAKVARLPSDKSALDLSVPNKAESYSSGVFYRQNVPYSLAISNDAGVKSLDFLMFSPNGSPTLFLPASRTLFSDNVAEFAFVDGSLLPISRRRRARLLRS